ncbi:Transcription elongation factor A protein 3 [Astathelohania contejeani]|uniref:Transcription elongation factor A protein 3 n=1 Tax=Astathelohania contejeani TaxID=164912 RepID=A0ABQ7I340_9MICR|nr:Transcription elongation factor A protein 3 [Thelohania contejeani]
MHEKLENIRKCIKENDIANLASLLNDPDDLDNEEIKKELDGLDKTEECQKMVEEAINKRYKKIKRSINKDKSNDVKGIKKENKLDISENKNMEICEKGIKEGDNFGYSKNKDTKYSEKDIKEENSFSTCKKTEEPNDKVKVAEIKGSNNASVMDANEKEGIKKGGCLINKQSGNTEDSKVIEKYFKNDKTRDRCIKLFFDAIIDTIEEPNYIKSAELAVEIEETFYKLNKNTDTKLIRSKYLNLKDKNNPDLCRHLYNRIITPERFVNMTTEEMKSDMLKKEESALIKKSIFDSSVAKMMAETDLFFCTKCKQRKCSYRQLQTRSADEPMTTYVYCVCGNTWKFC